MTEFSGVWAYTPDFNLHIVVSDKSEFADHVTVENTAGQTSWHTAMESNLPCATVHRCAVPAGTAMGLHCEDNNAGFTGLQDVIERLGGPAASCV